MAATSIQDIRDFHDVVRLLEEHPEWRAELRRLILSDELLALPQQMARLTEQVSRLTEQMATPVLVPFSRSPLPLGSVVAAALSPPAAPKANRLVALTSTGSPSRA